MQGQIRDGLHLLHHAGKGGGLVDTGHAGVDIDNMGAVALLLQSHAENIAVVSLLKGPLHGGAARRVEPVSYTHLDVYKRQSDNEAEDCEKAGRKGVPLGGPGILT